MTSKMHKKPIKRKWGHQELTRPSKIAADLTMFSICARTGTTQDIVLSETAASICMIGPTTRQAGSWRSSSKIRKGKDGNELTTQILPKRKTRKNFSKLCRNTVLPKRAKFVRINSITLWRSNVDTYSALPALSNCLNAGLATKG